MSLGVVPVVYDSFVAVRDILDNGKNGVIVPKVHNDFSAELMAKGLEKAIEDCEKNHDMALAAIEESKRYSLDEIYSRWLKFFDDIRNDKLIPN
jgi:glycosyltransferase involved in cell wall biosynthesis